MRDEGTEGEGEREGGENRERERMSKRVYM